MAKLPRRTMSMARRATKLAEDAAGVDAVEAIIGAPHAGKPPIFEGVIAWIAAIAGIVILMFAATLVCKVAETGHPDFSPAGALSREAPESEAFYREGNPNDGRMGSGRSPFPDARQEDPVILEVVCPPDTVHISTGSTPADSLCVVGQLAGTAPTPATVAPTPARGVTCSYSETFTHDVCSDGTFPCDMAAVPARGCTVQLPRALPDAGQGIDQSTIGATLVPFGLHCAEDELIGFDPTGQPTIDGLPIGCVHVDTLCPAGQHVGASDRCEQ